MHRRPTRRTRSSSRNMTLNGDGIEPVPVISAPESEVYSPIQPVHPGLSEAKRRNGSDHLHPPGRLRLTARSPGTATTVPQLATGGSKQYNDQRSQ